MILKVTTLLILICAVAFTAVAQKQMKVWTEWSKKDAEKILNSSGWGQTQVETDTRELLFTPTTPGNADRSAEGAVNQAQNVNFRVRFFSARPIRMALVRMIATQQQLNTEQTEGLKKFAELRTNEHIIVTVSYEANDQRYSGRLMQAFNSAETSTVKNQTWLERNDGKRIFAEEYVKPGKDGFGARFIFPRNLDGQPFLTSDFKQVRFHMEFGTTNVVRVDRPFKVSDMMFDGQLEY